MSDLELAGRRSHGRLSNLVKVKRTEVASTQDGKKSIVKIHSAGMVFVGGKLRIELIVS